MHKNNLSIRNIIQWCLFLAINLFFVAKYAPRADFNPWLAGDIYVILSTLLWYIYQHRVVSKIQEKTAKASLWTGTICIILCISGILYYIKPYTINVDRWSATTFFLEGLFRGEYPYGIHTHVSESNYPSPFPFWHYLHIPFLLLGDVGLELIFFLILTVVAIRCYTDSYKMTLGFVILLAMSPSYWWEVMTRSDGLSNALLVVSMILFAEHYHINLKDNFWPVAIVSGCLAATRLSAWIPIALYLFYPYLKSNWKIRIGLPLVVLGIVFLFFVPYIFWDTTTWPFFHRNPFMSQTSPGNIKILGSMIVIAIAIAARPKSLSGYMQSTGLFLFGFMLATDLGVLYHLPTPTSILDNVCDISYFTLSLPYCLFSLSCREPDVSRG